jgi:hypothetical protein
MSENICVPKNYFILLTFVLSFFTYIHSLSIVSNKENEQKNNYNIKMEYIDNEDSDTNSSPLDNDTNQDTIDKDLFIERDTQVINNILVAPERRLPRHAYPPKNLRDTLNVPTRGYPDNYQHMGMLIRKSDEKLLKLFGRQTYPGSNQYEYYVVDSNSSSDHKIPLKVQSNKELYDNEKMDIDWLDTSRGQFDIKIFDYNAPKYNPYDW